MENSGFPVVVSAPSGTGKTTICRRIAGSYPGARYSVSATTRPPREGEVDGQDYHFLDEETFQSWIKEGKFCEWAVVYGHHYGTIREQLENALAEGFKVIMDLDVNGGKAIRRLYAGGVLVYLLPPSEGALKERLVGRHTEESGAIERRLEDARGELDHIGDYHYVVVNQSVESTVEQIKSILAAEQCRVERQDLEKLLRGLGDLSSE